MSDCRIPMPSYKAPIHTREQDELRVTAHFKDGLHPQDFVANRDTPSGTRVLDYLESDGERYERVMECQNIEADSQGRFECSACGYEDWDTYTGQGIAFCPGCGAKVKVGE